MSNKEIIKEINATKEDLTSGNITFSEAVEGLERFSKYHNLNFNKLYNALYSSKPELYIY